MALKCPSLYTRYASHHQTCSSLAIISKPSFVTPASPNLPIPASPPSAVDSREIPHFDREQSIREGAKLYVPGPPFQFAVRTDKSMRKQDWTKMFPHFECVKDRIVLVPSFTTTSLAQSRTEVTRLYRKILRMLPTTLTDYNAWHIPGTLILAYIAYSH